MSFETALTGGHPNSLHGLDTVLRAARRDSKRLNHRVNALTIG